MIQGDFHRCVGSESVGLSQGQCRLVVKSLDGARGNRALGPESVEQQRACHLLHRPDLRTHRTYAPSARELFGPVRRDVAPEELEVFLEQEFKGSAPHGATFGSDSTTTAVCSVDTAQRNPGIAGMAERSPVFRCATYGLHVAAFLIQLHSAQKKQKALKIMP